MATFHALRDQTLALNDAMFAERVRHLPLDEGGRPDGSRQRIEIIAPLRAADLRISTLQGGRSQEWLTRISQSKLMLKIDPAAYPGLDIREKDVIVALERPGEPVYRVFAVDEQQHTRIIVYLGAK